LISYDVYIIFGELSNKSITNSLFVLIKGKNNESNTGSVLVFAWECILPSPYLSLNLISFNFSKVILCDLAFRLDNRVNITLFLLYGSCFTIPSNLLCFHISLKYKDSVFFSLNFSAPKKNVIEPCCNENSHLNLSICYFLAEVHS
jgi:hypothetical protein